MAKAAEVNVAFNAQMEGFSNGLKKGRKDLNDFGNDIKKGKGQLDELKKSLGEESKFGAFFKILGGAGAVAGLGMASRELEKFADKISHIKDEMASGATGGQIAAELLKSIPIAGSLGDSFARIRAELDGSADAARAMKIETAAITVGSDYAVARMERLKDQASGLAGMLRESRDVLADLGKGSADKAIHAVEIENRNKLEQAEKEAIADRKRIAEEAKAAREKYDDEYKSKFLALQGAADNLREIKERTARGQEKSPIYDSLGEAEQKFASAKLQFDYIANVRAGFAEKEQEDLKASADRLAAFKESREKESVAKRLEIEKQAVTDLLQFESKERARQMESSARSRDELTRMAGEANEARLRLAGRDADADLAQAVRDAQAHRDDIVGRLSDALASIGSMDIGSMSQEMQQASDELLAVEEALHLKQADILKRGNEERQRIQSDFDRARLERAEADAEVMESIQAEMRDAQLRRNGQAMLADKERAKREFEARERQVAEGLMQLPISPDAGSLAEFTRTLGLAAALKDQFDQQEAFRTPDIAPLPTATERRFDFTIPGLDQSTPAEALLGEQKKANEQGKKALELLKKLADSSLSVVGIK